MKRTTYFVAVIFVSLLGTFGPGIPGSALLGLSLISAAEAAPPRAHYRAHRTVRPHHRGRTRVDVDVDRSGSRYNRSVDVDVDVRRRPRPGAVARTIAVGTRVATLPRGCRTVVTYGVTYHHCGGVYYRPYYEGTTVVYVVVDAP